MATGFNPWVTTDPFHPSVLGSIESGEVRYVSLDEIRLTPPPVIIMWASRLALSSRVQTSDRRVAIERVADVYWVWLDARDYQYVRESEHAFPEVWAAALQMASNVTRPGVRPPADRPQTSRRPVITDPRDPASTNTTGLSHLVMLGAMVPDDQLPDDQDCSDSVGIGADCAQDAPTVQVDMTPAVATDAGSASPSHHAPHDPGPTHSSPNDGGGGWADSGGFSCGGGSI